MNINQLRFIVEVASNGFNISQAALTLNTTQPGISSQINALEKELNVPIFLRNGKRLTGITEPGQTIVKLALEIVRGVSDIKHISADFADEHRGTLSIATTHTQARYTLPKIVARFRQQFPDVTLRLHQGNPRQLCEMVLAGEADFAIATETIAQYSELSMLPCFRWNRCVVAIKGHPLLKAKPLTLEKIAQYPIITYDTAFAGRSVINKAFTRAGVTPNIVLTAIDSDVIKTYVSLGLGIGILAQMAFDEERDKELGCRDASHLFEDSVTCLGFRRGRYLRGYMLAFIKMVAPSLSQKSIEKASRT